MKKIKKIIVDFSKKNVVFRKLVRSLRLFFNKMNFLKRKMNFFESLELLWIKC